MTVSQILVTVLLIYILLRKPETRAEMGRALQNSDKRWFLAGLGAYGAVVLLGSVRWHILLRVQKIRIGYSRVLQLFMIGSFFNLFLLGTVGGDVVKGYYLLRETSEPKSTALLTILMDRIIGLVALIVLSAVIVGLQYELFLSTAGTRAFFIAVVLLLAAASAVLLVSFVVTGLGLVERLPQRLPGRGKLIELSAAYNLYGHSWKTSLAAFVISLVSHLCSFLGFYFAARAFTEVISLGSILTVMPIVSTLTAIPITFSGAGVREVAFETLLRELYGVPTELALLVSLSGFMVIVVGSSVGGLVYLAYRSGDSAARPGATATTKGSGQGTATTKGSGQGTATTKG